MSDFMSTAAATTKNGFEMFKSMPTTANTGRHAKINDFDFSEMAKLDKFAPPVTAGAQST
jgi:hypothetical protein